MSLAEEPNTGKTIKSVIALTKRTKCNFLKRLRKKKSLTKGIVTNVNTIAATTACMNSFNGIFLLEYRY
ncbi:hypothetical protein [Oceanobacillus sp. CAU 1775]